ncbi:MAG: protein-export chaperone SecB [Sterolibacterium sp.]|jgi:preprotein translocase subunit SecB|nr:protein-export chaperone SecB [Sterolibacterium sp.]
MSEQQAPVFTIEKVYAKDISLEIPNAPQVFLSQDNPAIEMQLQTEAANIEDGLYEVTVTVTITAKHADKTVFLVEVGQAGIFQLRNLPTDNIEPILGVACPNIVFPYLRETVSDLVTRAGFPPVLLAPINFEAMYAQRVQAQQQAQQGQAAGEIPIQ